MSISMFGRYGIYASRFGSLFLNNLKMTGFNPAATKVEVTPGGLIDRAYLATAFADPLIRVQTTDLLNVLVGTPSVGLDTGYVCDSSRSSEPTLSTILQLQKRAPGGIFAAANAGTHQILTSTKGFLYIDEISVEQDSQEGAQISLTYYALSPDGETTPVVMTEGNLAGTPAVNNVWFLGPTFIGSTGGSPTRLTGVQRVTIRPGLQFVPKRGDGTAYCIDGSIVSRKPEIRLKFTDLDQLYTYWPLLFGNNQTSSSRLNIYLQRGALGGVRTARASPVHFQIYCDTAMIDPEDISVSGENDADIELVFRVSNSALALASNVAIHADP